MRIWLHGISTDVKPTDEIEEGSVYLEEDTAETYYLQAGSWIRRTTGNKTYLWNSDSLSWEAATKGSGVGQAVSVENFPASLTGSTIPIEPGSPADKYAITDIDDAGTTKYFGYLDKNGNWYVMQLTDTGARYTRGSTGYQTNWNGRTGLSYDYFDIVF
jgi:hypothetical protein